MTQVRKARHADRPDLFLNEGPDGWPMDQLLRLVRDDRAVTVVATDDRDVAVAHAVYTLQRDHVALERVAVRDGYRRRGIGKGLVAWVKGKLSRLRPELRVWVPDSTDSLGEQVFLRACGFPWAYVDDDHVRFTYRLPAAARKAVAK